jgi:hypothetical protein
MNKNPTKGPIRKYFRSSPRWRLFITSCTNSENINHTSAVMIPGHRCNSINRHHLENMAETVSKHQLFRAYPDRGPMIDRCTRPAAHPRRSGARISIIV